MFRPRWSHERLLAFTTGTLLCILVTLGFWLRMRDIATEAMQWDEVTGYNATLGLRERGFPSLHVHPDAPVTYMATSEIVFIFTALASLVFDDARYVMRFPPVCWSTLTIVLIYLVGRRMFTRRVGLVAAAIYTLAPAVIATSNFGRYLEQLQFLTLLTVYFFWLTIRGPGPLNTRAL
jgi:4-amino-4-deoxy-L-arabinose transferase-like glycosyltransferase